METGNIIALASCAVGFFSFLVTLVLSSNNTSRAMGKMESKIDSLKSDVDSLKTDVRNLETVVTRHDEKLDRLSSDVGSMKEQIKSLEKALIRHEEKIGLLPCSDHEQRLSAIAVQTEKNEFAIGALSGRGGATESHSPETLSDKGRRFAADLDFEGQLSKCWPAISAIPGDAALPYDIQQKLVYQLMFYPEKYVDEDFIAAVKNAAYQSGMTLQDIMRAFAIMARDRYLSQIGLA